MTTQGQVLMNLVDFTSISQHKQLLFKYEIIFLVTKQIIKTFELILKD